MLHDALDYTQASFWDAYRFSQRLLVQVLDECVMNSVENTVDRTINKCRELPSEVIVE